MSRDLEQRLRESRDALPQPSARATMQARELVVGAALGRRRKLRASAAVVVLAAAIVIGVGAGLWLAPSGGASAPEVAGLGFLPAKGWTIVQSAPGNPTRSNALAANVPVHPDDMPIDGPPYRTIRTLPPDGVVIFAEFSARGETWTDAGYPVEAAPPRLDDAYRETDWAAQIRPQDPVAQYRLAYATAGYNVELRVYAGRLRPTDEQLAGAQRQLDRIVVAGDPITIQARPLVVPWAAPVSLSGSVTSGRADEDVVIEERRCGAITLAWTQAVAAHTDPGGGWSAHAAAPITTSFRAVWNGKISNVVTVRARPGVVLRQSRRTRFHVGVGGLKDFKGKIAVLERFDNARGRWVTVKRFRLTNSGIGGMVRWSDARVPAFVRPGTLVRAVFPRASAGECYLAGYSNMVRTVG